MQAFDSGRVDLGKCDPGSSQGCELPGGATKVVTVWRHKWGLGVPGGGGHSVCPDEVGACVMLSQQESVSHGRGV